MNEFGAEAGALQDNDPVITRRRLIVGLGTIGGALLAGCTFDRKGTIASETIEPVVDTAETIADTVADTKVPSTTTIPPTPTSTVDQYRELDLNRATQATSTSTTTTTTSTTTSTTTTTTTIPVFEPPKVGIGESLGLIYAGNSKAVAEFRNGKRDLGLRDGLKIAADLKQGDNPWSPDPATANQPSLGYIDNGPGVWKGNGLFMPGEAQEYVDSESNEVNPIHSVIFGHRVTALKDANATRLSGQDAGPFRHLDQIMDGDELVIEYLNGDDDTKHFVYRAVFLAPSGRARFKDSAAWVADPVADVNAVLNPDNLSVPTVTTFACHEPGSIQHRIVVRYEQVA